MPDIVHRIGTNVSKEKVYDAIATIEGIKGWWTEYVDGEYEEGQVLTFRFPETGPRMVVLKLEPPDGVGWKCIEGIEDWRDTEITFDIYDENGQTIVKFAQRYFDEENEKFAHCSSKWAVFLLSLKQFLEEGKGRPFPNDIKIEKDM